MRKIIIIILAFMVYQKWDTISTHFNTPTKTADYSQADVVVYVTSWCGYCKQTTAFLKANQIPFKEYDIERTYEGKTRYAKLGVKGVPVVVINDNLVRGHNPKEILAYLHN